MTILYTKLSDWFKSFFLFAFLFSSHFSMAQCGDRFLNDVFEDNQITVTQDVQYGSNIAINGDDVTLKFDFFEPAQTEDPMEARPLIIWAHGGFFINGNENDMAFLGEAYAKRGYACASINYRLLTTADAFANISDLDDLFVDEIARSVADMRAAIRYFRQDADTDNTYRIDPNQIFVGGISAGGVLAAHVGYMTDEQGVADYETVDILSYIEASGGFEGDSGNPGYSSHVSGIISFSGAIGDTSFMQAGEVPIISVHDDGDSVVPYDADMVVFPGVGVDIAPMMGSEMIHIRAENLGITNHLLTYENSDGHVAYFNNGLNSADGEMADNFTKENLYNLVECTQETAVVEETEIICDASENSLTTDSVFVAGTLQDSLYIVSTQSLLSSVEIVQAESDGALPNDTMIFANIYGCDSTVVTEYTAVGVETVSTMDIRVYPNPVSDVFTVELFGEQQEKVDLRLFDLSGKKLLEYGTLSNQFVNIDVTELAAGIYTLMIDTEAGSVYRKIVRSK